MKILVIPTWYPNGVDKLMGIYHKEFTEALNDFGNTADIVYIDRQPLSHPIHYLHMPKNEVIHEKNYTIYITKMLNLSRFNFDLQIKYYVNYLEKSVEKYISLHGKPDIIHAHVTIPAGYAATKIGQKLQIPVLVTEHASNFEQFYQNKLLNYSQYVFENAHYSTVSHYMKKIVLKHTNTCYVIPNLVDIEPFLTTKKRKLTNDFQLVMVCALRKGKRLDIAFQALKILLDQGFKITLDIIGDGFFEDYFKEVCQQLNLSSYVHFLGRKNKYEIAEIMKKKHALLISSEIESFGIPGIEAMASGLPVISTKCFGPEEYITKKSGVLCEVNQSEDMARAILAVYHNYDDYHPKEIQAIARQYDKKHIVKQTIKIYQEILKQNQL